MKQKIECSGISGFETRDSIINILDNNKRPFYFRLNPEQAICKFNLPKGLYFTNNTIKTCKPVQYKLPELPKAERIFSLPESLKITFGKNKNKCSVNLNNGHIFFDTEFYNSLTKPELQFVLFHEIGHFYYSGNGITSEKNCDLFACHYMLKIGYNPNQILRSSLNTLGANEYSGKRKVETFFHTKNI